MGTSRRSPGAESSHQGLPVTWGRQSSASPAPRPCCPPLTIGSRVSPAHAPLHCTEPRSDPLVPSIPASLQICRGTERSQPQAPPPVPETAPARPRPRPAPHLHVGEHPFQSPTEQAPRGFLLRAGISAPLLGPHLSPLPGPRHFCHTHQWVPLQRGPQDLDHPCSRSPAVCPPMNVECQG